MLDPLYGNVRQLIRILGRCVCACQSCAGVVVRECTVVYGLYQAVVLSGEVLLGDVILYSHLQTSTTWACTDCVCVFVSDAASCFYAGALIFTLHCYLYQERCSFRPFVT